MNRFAAKLTEQSLPLRHTRTQVLQITVGKLCNLTCVHCHVNAGPKRKEIMTRETVDRLIDWLAQTDIPTVDLTGGAPEMSLERAMEDQRLMDQVYVDANLPPTRDARIGEARHGATGSAPHV